MFVYINSLIWKFFGRRFTYNVNTVTDEQYEILADADFIDMENFHNLEYDSKPFREMRRELKQRRNWYVRHGFYDLAEDLDTALWVVKRYAR